MKLDDFEHRILVNALNSMRNKIIQEGRYNEGLDRLIFKGINAPVSKRHLRYTKEHKRALHSELVMSAKLNSYLADIDRQAEDMLFLLMEEMAENASVTEQFKAGNQLEWVQRMNNIRQSASEMVSNDVNKFLISQKEQPQILRLLHKIIAK